MSMEITKDSQEGLLTQGPIFGVLTKLSLPIVAAAFLSTL